jgi:hypothetical protein
VLRIAVARIDAIPLVIFVVGPLGLAALDRPPSRWSRPSLLDCRDGRVLLIIAIARGRVRETVVGRVIGAILVIVGDGFTSRAPENCMRVS